MYTWMSTCILYYSAFYSTSPQSVFFLNCVKHYVSFSCVILTVVLSKTVEIHETYLFFIFFFIWQSPSFSNTTSHFCVLKVCSSTFIVIRCVHSSQFSTFFVYFTFIITWATLIFCVVSCTCMYLSHSVF